jgi:hypothetical protein
MTRNCRVTAHVDSKGRPKHSQRLLQLPVPPERSERLSQVQVAYRFPPDQACAPLSVVVTVA